MTIRYINQLRPTEKIKILEVARRDCLEHHLCGDYIRLCGEDMFWNIEARKYNYNLLAYTSKGIIKHRYDFDFTFNENLCSLVDNIMNKLEA